MPGHRDSREHGGNGTEVTSLEGGDIELLPKRTGSGIRGVGGGIWGQGSGRRLQPLDQEHRAGERGSRARIARRQVRKWEAFVELGGTFCPSRC